jgi:hypothetical protein
MPEYLKVSAENVLEDLEKFQELKLLCTRDIVTTQ